MSFLKEALEFLELKFNQGTALKTDTPAILVPDGMDIENLEYLQNTRSRFRGKFSTSQLADFVAYIAAQDTCTCFIADERPSAWAVFDMGTEHAPGFCSHVATFELKKTAEYRALHRLLDTAYLNQRELAEFMEDWMDLITCTDAADNNLDTAKAIRAIRKITIKTASEHESSVQNLSTSKSNMEKMDAVSQYEDLPGSIYFHCIPYHGLNNYSFPMRFSIKISNSERDQVMIGLRPIQFEKIVEDYVREFQASLQTALDDVEVYMGSFAPNYK